MTESIDFERLVGSPIQLFITATNVRTGRGHIFRNGEITADVLLASACLPTMFQAVEIDGEAYWDGGYAGNPTHHAADPRKRCARHDPRADQSARTMRTCRARLREILNRLNEISFNSPLMKELRMMALLRQVADPGTGEGARWARMRTHRVMTDVLAQIRRLFEAQCRVGFRLHAAGRGTARPRAHFSRSMPTTSASVPPPIWTCCWQSADERAGDSAGSSETRVAEWVF